VPDAIARVGEILIGPILAPALSGADEVGHDVPARRFEQRLPPRPAPRGHAAESAQTGASHQPHEQRLELIVRGVGGGDPPTVRARRGAREERASQRTQAGLTREPEPAHAEPRVPPRVDQRDVEASTQLADEIAIAIRFGATEAVMEVRGVELETELVRDPVEAEQQCRGIRSAADRDQEPASGFRGAGAAKRSPEDGLETA
jgi:hypothetical protein